MIDRLILKGITLAILFFSGCSPQKKIENIKDVTHSSSLEEINSILAGKWQSAQERDGVLYFLPSFSGSKDSNIIRIGESMHYYTLDSARNESVISWFMIFHLKTGETSRVYIRQLTSDSLRLWEQDELLSGLYLKKQ